MRINKKLKILALSLFGLLMSCSDYLDIVPDNVATIDYAFRLRSTAERFLFSCYSYMPAHARFVTNPAFVGGDEIWLQSSNTNPAWQIAKGNQNVVNPYMDFWDGDDESKDLYEGIRQCNIFTQVSHPENTEVSG